MNILLLSIVIPAVAGLISFLIPKKGYSAGVFSTILAAFNLYLMIKLFGQETSFSMLWGGGWGLEFSLRMYKFASFILVSVALFAFLISLYSTSFMKDNSGSKQFFAYL